MSETRIGTLAARARESTDSHLIVVVLFIAVLILAVGFTHMFGLDQATGDRSPETALVEQ